MFVLRLAKNATARACSRKRGFACRALDSPLANASSAALLALPPPPSVECPYYKGFQLLSFSSLYPFSELLLDSNYKTGLTCFLSFYIIILNYVPGTVNP